MNKNILGDWGAGLNDHDYGRALAALGVLEATGTAQHKASSKPEDILAVLNEEFKDSDRTAIWRGAYNVTGSTLKSWRETIHQDVQALAEGWELLLQRADHPRQRPRLAVEAGWRRRPDLFDLETLMSLLGADDTGLQALVVAPEELQPEECRTIWHWPLKIGVPAGPQGEPLLVYLQNIRNGWIETLGLLQIVGEARDACDLLILPPGRAAQLSEQPRLRLRASFIVCLDDPVGWSVSPDTYQARLREKMGAAGIALIGESFDQKYWYEWLMRELSHDLPVHAALWGVGRYRLNRLPVILGEPRSLDRLRILAVAEHLDRKYELLPQPEYLASPSKEEPVPLSPEITRSRGWFSRTLDRFDYFRRMPKRLPEPESETPPPPHPYERLSEMVRNRPFFSETHDGLPQAEAIEAREAEMEEKRCIRHIQANAWREDVGSGPAGALAPDRPNLLTVHVGPDKKPRPDPPFPEGEIDFTTGPVDVSVQLELAGANVASVRKEAEIRALGFSFPQLPADETARLFQLLDSLVAASEPAGSGQVLVSLASENIKLPAAGDSPTAIFAVRPQPGVQEVQGRIAILYQNRIVQTACLTSPVDLRGDVGEGITVAAEAIVHSRLDDLPERRQFDLALIAADDLGSRLRLTVNCDGNAQEVDVESLDDAIQKIQGAIYETARRPEDKMGLDTEAMRQILRSLAGHGRLLYDALHRVLGDKLDGSTRLQLVSRGKAFFPLEYVYDGPRLKLNVPVCPNAAEAMRRLPEGDCRACSHKESKDHLCPLNFWGFTKVIERHGEVPKDRCISSVGVDRIKLPSPTRSPFGPAQPVLFAASSRAFKFSDGPAYREKLMQSLSRLGGGSPPMEVKTWDEWREGVGSTTPPKVLVLLPHTDQALINLDALEIEDQELLAKDEIDTDVVGPGETIQLLLLLGCSAAEVRKSFAPYPNLFRTYGADIVIAPITEILGADAVPISNRIAEMLAERMSPGKQVAFGELLRDLRRELLAEGHPGVLTLVGFGDADWVFGG